MTILRISFLSAIVFFISCNDDPINRCSDTQQIISEYTSQEGDQIQIFEDGKAYIANDNCSIVAQIFEPGFFDKSYEETQDGIFIIVDETTRYPVQQSFSIDFENIDDWRDLLITENLERDRLFTSLTLQSPSTPTVELYNELKRCLVKKECDFIDNRIDLAADPEDDKNQVLRFYSIAPTPDMITSKCSISGSTLFFRKGDDFWFQARYYIEKGRPQTIADFESEYFIGHMGPRLIFRGKALNVENKFADKLNFSQIQEPALDLPIRQWVKVKVHMKYDESDGIIQVWQDDELIIDTKGQNMPFDFWIQNLLEVGISASSEETILMVDDVQFGQNDFN